MEAPHVDEVGQCHEVRGGFEDEVNREQLDVMMAEKGKRKPNSHACAAEENDDILEPQEQQD